MKELRFIASKNTPEVILQPDGFIRIRGRSIHENVLEFYEPVENWVSEYMENPAEITHVDMNLEYFNSASAKVFIQLLQKISSLSQKDRKYEVNWYYEEGDEDIIERGEYFSSVLEMQFNFICNS